MEGNMVLYARYGGTKKELFPGFGFPHWTKAETGYNSILFPTSLSNL